MVSSAIGFTTLVLYMLLISNQGSGLDRRVLFVAAFMFLATCLAGIGAFAAASDRPYAQPLLYAAAGAFGTLGVLALMSIGILLILAAAFAIAGAGPRHTPTAVFAASLAAPVALLVLGLLATA